MIIEEFNNNQEAADFLKSNKGLLFKELYAKIQEAVKNGEDTATAANLIIGDMFITISVEKKRWSHHLTISLDYFLKAEDYEMCAKIRDLMNTI